MEKYVPLLVDFMNRDEDILQEETSDALIAFQSDEVVEAVAEMMSDSDDIIFPVSVLANTKTPLAVEKLRELYKKTTDDENKTMIIEALCHQLTEEALPEIEQFAKEGYNSYLVEVENLLYGFHKVMGIDHPKLQQWRQIAEDREEEFRKLQSGEKGRAPDPLDPGIPYRNTEKVGRNDPCPCGSGKKYKKCCGA
ncbi:SEC-C metal-binding domain-containing protein [Bacillus sp. T33-2]|uniref:SEC-C metal-binding domain-containing protein n=1 Tax=Bacillus sp. T33-2 TaxID=2054168 RepID=UPI001C608C15|nr:SEC-C metal-binding domain-containing protein [Bacillus sp. T33-2]